MLLSLQDQVLGSLSRFVCLGLLDENNSKRLFGRDGRRRRAATAQAVDGEAADQYQQDDELRQ